MASKYQEMKLYTLDHSLIDTLSDSSLTSETNEPIDVITVNQQSESTQSSESNQPTQTDQSNQTAPLHTNTQRKSQSKSCERCLVILVYAGLLAAGISLYIHGKNKPDYNCTKLENQCTGYDKDKYDKIINCYNEVFCPTNCTCLLRKNNINTCEKASCITTRGHNAEKDWGFGILIYLLVCVILVCLLLCLGYMEKRMEERNSN